MSALIGASRAKSSATRSRRRARWGDRPSRTENCLRWLRKSSTCSSLSIETFPFSRVFLASRSQSSFCVRVLIACRTCKPLVPKVLASLPIAKVGSVKGPLPTSAVNHALGKRSPASLRTGSITYDVRSFGPPGRQLCPGGRCGDLLGGSDGSQSSHITFIGVAVLSECSPDGTKWDPGHSGDGLSRTPLRFIRARSTRINKPETRMSLPITPAATDRRQHAPDGPAPFEYLSLIHI